MPSDPLRRKFLRQVFAVPSVPGLFNPYAGEDPALDCPGAARIRRANLRRYTSGFSRLPRVCILGEAPGPRGCRFSGVPFTSERQLSGGELPFKGSATSLGNLPLAELSASVFWDVMRPYYPDFFAWNALPFHPHIPGKPLSVRRPAGSEIQQFAGILESLLNILEPDLIIAVGRVAEQAVTRLGHSCVCVRHPAHGGAAAFRQGMLIHLDCFSANHGSSPCSSRF